MTEEVEFERDLELFKKTNFLESKSIDLKSSLDWSKNQINITESLKEAVNADSTSNAYEKKSKMSGVQRLFGQNWQGEGK